MGEFLPHFTSWLLTFVLHSTLWLGGAWLALRAAPGASAALRDFVWRAALIASLATPTVQAWTGVAPLGGAWRVAQPRLEAAPAAPRVAVMAPAATEGTFLAAPAVALAFATARVDESVAGAPPEPPPAAAPGPVRSWRDLLLAVWAAGAALAAGALLLQAVRLRRSLRDRVEVAEGAAARALDAWRPGAGSLAARVRLTSSVSLEVPIALGVLRPEICVPRRALRDLGPAQQRALVGHELAHVLRRDPFWLSLFVCVERVLWFQPLLRLARRGAHRAAEEACDAWAARRTGDPVALADTLVEVARWLSPRPRALAAACMARPDSPLRQRVTRLLDGVSESGESLPAWARATAAATMAGAVVLMPGVSCHADPVWPEGAYVVPADATPSSELAAIRQQMDWIAAEIEAARAEAENLDQLDAAARLDLLQGRLDVLAELASSLSDKIEHSSLKPNSR